MRPVASFAKAPRRQDAKRTERIIAKPGEEYCRGCNDNGTIEIHPEAIGEHSPLGVRSDLTAGNLKLCDCEMGRFWATMTDSAPAKAKGP